MIAHGISHSAKAEFLGGVHQLTDRFMLALYGPGADLTPETAHYTEIGEIDGRGYRRGGVQLRNPKVWMDRECGCLTFDSIRMTNTTISANAGLIYNASKGNKAIAVIDFGGSYTSTVGNFDITIPADLICFE